MAYQRGSLIKLHRKAGDIWVLRYRENRIGKRVQSDLPVCLVRDFPKQKEAWREVDRLGLLLRINADHLDNRVRFRALAEHYLIHDVGPDALRPKSERTALYINQIVRTYLIPQWGESVADDINPMDIQQWLKSLHTNNGLAWPTVAKFRGIMLRIYRIGALHQLVKNNPVLPVETRSITDYKAILVTPKQTWAIIESLANPLHRILVLTCAATTLRASELIALRWADLLWQEEKIAISKRWWSGDGPTKTRRSEGHVPMHPVLARFLQAWREKTPFAGDGDFIFPSLKAEGKVPLSAGVFVSGHLRPAAKAAGLQIPEGYRFGLHNLRHSLSSWLVNKGKADPKTVQSLLRHSRIQTTLDLYTQGDVDETRVAQGTFLREMGLASELVQ
jgi:integrase